MGKARISSGVRRQLNQIFAFITERDSAEAARKVAARILETIDDLADQPGMGAKRNDLAAGIRSFPVFKYLIFYREISGGIEVVHIVHDARDLRQFFR